MELIYVALSFNYAINLSPLILGKPNGSFRRNICSAGLNRLMKYSDLIAMKTRNFFTQLNYPPGF